MPPCVNCCDTPELAVVRYAIYSILVNMKGFMTMNKLLAALIAGLIATSAFAAEETKAEAAPAAAATEEAAPAKAPVKKKAHKAKKAKKAEKAAEAPAAEAAPAAETK